MASSTRYSPSKAALPSNTAHKTDAETGPSQLGLNTEKRPTLDDLLRMPLEESGEYLRRAAERAADEYLNDPSVTEFTCLDSEDFEDYSD